MIFVVCFSCFVCCVHGACRDAWLVRPLQWSVNCQLVNSWRTDARAVRPYILLPYFVHFLLVKGHEKANKGNSEKPFVYWGYALFARAYVKTFKRQVR